MGFSRATLSMAIADYVVTVVAGVAGPTICTAGGTHEPFKADSCGQYRRKIN